MAAQVRNLWNKDNQTFLPIFWVFSQCCFLLQPFSLLTEATLSVLFFSAAWTAQGVFQEQEESKYFEQKTAIPSTKVEHVYFHIPPRVGTRTHQRFSYCNMWDFMCPPVLI